MHPIEDITKEHGPVKLMLRILEKMNEMIADGMPVAKDDLDRAVVFLREFADKFHHAKEENHLFPIMKENGIREEVELIDMLIEEHAQARVYIANMSAAVDRQEESPAESLRTFLSNSEKYIELLDQHVDKENAVLFTDAHHSLSEDQLARLQEGFENAEKTLLSTGRHDDLLRIVHELHEDYLPAHE